MRAVLVTALAAYSVVCSAALASHGRHALAVATILLGAVLILAALYWRRP